MATLVQADTVYSFTGTAADLLKQYPDSPYTAFVVTTQDQIECYAQHCARLSEGLSALVAVNGTDCCVAPDVGGVHHDPCMSGEPAGDNCLFAGQSSWSKSATQGPKPCHQGSVSLQSHTDRPSPPHSHYGHCIY